MSNSKTKHSLPRAIQLAHQLVSERLGSGDTAVDATVGNGHDTLFLAKLVGNQGAVIGFDVQEQAISGTRQKTKDLAQVQLHLAGHETIGNVHSEAIQVAMFNLGYLPRADKQVITRSDTTIRALDSILPLLNKQGIITLVIYTGHDGGMDEADSIHSWAETLDQTEFTVAEYRFLNQRNSPPHLVVIERK